MNYFILTDTCVWICFYGCCHGPQLKMRVFYLAYNDFVILGSVRTVVDALFSIALLNRKLQGSLYTDCLFMTPFIYFSL